MVEHLRGCAKCRTAATPALDPVLVLAAVPISVTPAGFKPALIETLSQAGLPVSGSVAYRLPSVGRGLSALPPPPPGAETGDPADDHDVDGDHADDEEHAGQWLVGGLPPVDAGAVLAPPPPPDAPAPVVPAFEPTAIGTVARSAPDLAARRKRWFRIADA